MALRSFLTLKGQKSGIIRGSVTQKGREGSIAVLECSHEISSPTDQASGLPTGKTRHSEFTIRKELDQSSPLLYNMLVNNENITDFTLRFWAPNLRSASGVGSEAQHYTVKLVNARISRIQFWQPNAADPEQQRFAEYEEISFVYQKIEWTWMQGGITAADDWEA